MKREQGAVLVREARLEHMEGVRGFVLDVHTFPVLSLRQERQDEVRLPPGGGRVIIGTAVIGFLLGLVFSYLVMQDDTLSLGDRIFFSVCVTFILVTAPTAMVVNLS